MPLNLQIASFIFSVVFGIGLSLSINLSYKYMYEGKWWFKILINLFFVIDIVLIYFIGLKIINDGVLHVYFILMVIFGYLIAESIRKKIHFKIKSKKNDLLK
jgi:hypothetical protein